jgi:hypothetical protein
VSARQRLAFLAVAAVIAVVAVVLLSTGSGSSGTSDTTSVPVLHGATVTHIKVTEGERVRFQVRSPKRQEVHVHGYNFMKDAAPGAPARFDFKATITGRFDIEFEEAGQQIGELEVDPG